MNLKSIIFIILTITLFTAGCAKTDRELLLEKLNYENRRFGFSMKFPETWSKYSVSDRHLLIDENLEIYGISFILPTRSRDWQPVDAPAKSAVLFRIYIFSGKEWEYYEKTYYGRPEGFHLNGRIVGKKDGKVYFADFSRSVPIDLYIFVRDAETIVSTFRFMK